MSRTTGHTATAPTSPSRSSNRHRRALAGALLGLTAVLAGCAGTGATTLEPAAPAAEEATAPAAGSPVSGPAVKLAPTVLGDVLVGPEGLTLYGFLNDPPGLSTCSGTCAEAWPPLIVGPDWDSGPELDVGIFATTTREDGSQQLVAGKWPLYYYAGDSAPGDVTGQGSGEVWFVVDAQGALVTSDAPAGPPGTAPEGGAAPAEPGSTDVREANSTLGRILVDGDGRTLYGFTKDSDGEPTCEGGCAEAWPPVIVEDGEVPAGLDPAVFSVVERPDGELQLKAGKWPLYRFGGDSAPGDVNGQSSGGVWFVIDGRGALIKDANKDAGGSKATTTSAASSSGY